MARHIQNTLNYFLVPGASNPAVDLWRYHLDVAASHPEIVEWELVDDHIVSQPVSIIVAPKSIISYASLVQINPFHR